MAAGKNCLAAKAIVYADHCKTAPSKEAREIRGKLTVTDAESATV
jgi:hypothetical protein